MSKDDDEIFVEIIYSEILNDITYLNKISPAYIQRRYHVDYDIASNLIVLLEENGIIGPVDGAKPRDVLIKSEEI